MRAHQPAGSPAAAASAPGGARASSLGSNARRCAPLRASRPGLAPAPPPAGERGAPPAGPRERVLRSGDLVATSTALGTSINYKIKPDGRPAIGGGGGGAAGAAPAPVREFVDKLWLAWQIFFPEKAPELSPKDGAKQRLRMILVADRCGMSPTGLSEMKRNILRALEEFVDIESEEQIDVSISVEPEVGTIYQVAVPVRRVKPEARMELEGGEIDGMAVLEWNPDDRESDPSSRFPMGC